MLEERMQRILKDLSFHALLISVSLALSREGFSDVHLLGRRTSKQKSSIGGCELVAHQKLGLFDTKTLVKVIADDVRLRMLDEMTGVMPRAKANFGIIVTPCSSTKQVKMLNREYPGNPIRIIEGPELARLLVQHRIGVRDVLGTLVPDHFYFQHLEYHCHNLAEYLKSNREFR